METSKLITEECDFIKKILLEKNKKYGDSALNPVRIFSKATEIEQLKVRLDDELSRIKNNDTLEDEDVVLDMIGYLILLRIGMKSQEQDEIQAVTEDTEAELLIEYLDINNKNKK